MTAMAVRLLVALALLAGAYWAGDHNRNNAWLAKQASVERDAHAKYEAEVMRGNDAFGAFLVEHQAMQGKFENLTEKFNELGKRAPLLAARSPGVVCGPAPGEAEMGVAAVPDVGAPDRLTTGAVWMWNSALTGTDQPSGACGLADTSQAACAAATTATVDDAWANHKTNAQLCAEDRLVHQRLFDYLTSRKTK
jgi:hypothetical protein